MEQALDLNIEILADQGIAVVRCRGGLKFGKEAQLLTKCVESVLSQFSICVLSLQGVHEIDARGLGTVVACLGRARSLGCTLLIGGASAKVRELFKMMRLDKVLEIYESVFEAIEACGQAA